jgi:hypothetical protein
LEAKGEKRMENKDYDAIIADQNKKIAELMEKLNNLTSGEKKAVVPQATDSVNLVYMSDSLGHIETKNIAIDCTKFGESFVLSRSQFDEVVGKYRSWFDKGILAVGPENIDIAAKKGLRVSTEYDLDMKKLEALGKDTPEQIEKLWKDPSLTSAQRLSICTFYKKHFMQGDPGYKEIMKVSLLDKLTNGGFAREVAECSRKDGVVKYTPTDMVGDDSQHVTFNEYQILDKDFRSDVQ